MTDQEKLGVLISDFGKLEESRKDYIRELVQKLAGIHCSGELPNGHGGREPERCDFSGIYPA